MLNIYCHSLTVRCDFNSIAEFFIHAAHTEKRNIIEKLLGRNFFPLWSLSWGSGRIWREILNKKKLSSLGQAFPTIPFINCEHMFSTLSHNGFPVSSSDSCFFSNLGKCCQRFSLNVTITKKYLFVKNVGVLGWKAFLDSSCNPGLHRNWNWE